MFSKQQKQIYDNLSHSIENRIVSIHQPHIRPVKKGRSPAKAVLEAKIHVSLIHGISLLDELSREAFNETSHIMNYIEN